MEERAQKFTFNDSHINKSPSRLLCDCTETYHSLNCYLYKTPLLVHQQMYDFIHVLQIKDSKKNGKIQKFRDVQYTLYQPRYHSF